MGKENLIEGKRILIVDDEPDVLDTLENFLDKSEVVKALTFDDAKKLLEDEYFDIAVLDIMGVDGYRLLDIANENNVVAVMLTAHALSIGDTKKSFLKGAAFFIPKEEMRDIVKFLNDVLRSRKKGKSTWSRWMERLDWYYNNRFGPDYKTADKEFWDSIIKK